VIKPAPAHLERVGYIFKINVTILLKELRKISRRILEGRTGLSRDQQ
jgi:hypothetical protein